MTLSHIPKKPSKPTSRRRLSSSTPSTYIKIDLNISAPTNLKQPTVNKISLILLTLLVLLGLTFMTSDSVDTQLPDELLPYISSMLNTGGNQCNLENTFLIEQLFNK